MDADIIIIGGGAAGLYAALQAAPLKAIILCPSIIGKNTASMLSQGGIAAAVATDDSPDIHLSDTLKAGAGISDNKTARDFAKAAPDHIRQLDALGVTFERENDGTYKLSREACHSTRRVLKARAGDGFGKVLMSALGSAVQNAEHITVLENTMATELLQDINGRIYGVQARNNSKPLILTSGAVILATGGIGGLYAATTNPLTSLGQGIAVAAQKGAVLADLEFVQFHPTALNIGLDPAPLATEALRGEGAILITGDGSRFVDELLPRDAVSRAVFARIEAGQRVFLDCRDVLGGREQSFPNLVRVCQAQGIDPVTQPVPVRPAVHYHMGGIAADLNGRTSLSGLWVCGEVASTGLHGANRLASNSLMEAVIMGGNAAEDIKNSPAVNMSGACVKSCGLTAPPDINHAGLHMLRGVMTQETGVIRTQAGLQNALDVCAEIQALCSPEMRWLSNAAMVSGLIVQSALQRTESRGSHTRKDYPEQDAEWARRSFVQPGQFPARSGQYRGAAE